MCIPGLNFPDYHFIEILMWCSLSAHQQVLNKSIRSTPWGKKKAWKWHLGTTLQWGGTNFYCFAVNHYIIILPVLESCNAFQFISSFAKTHKGLNKSKRVWTSLFITQAYQLSTKRVQTKRNTPPSRWLHSSANRRCNNSQTQPA